MYAKYTQIGRYHELMLGTCCLSYICSLNPKYLTCTSIMVTTMTLSNNNTFTNIVNKILQIIDTLQYSQRHDVVGRCGGRVALLGDVDVSLVLFSISSRFLLYLECYLLSLKMQRKVGKCVERGRRCICIAGMSDASVTVICHSMSLTVL